MEKSDNKSGVSDKIITELLKQKIEIGYGMVRVYITAFTIYVAIIGAILKFTFETDASTEFRIAILTFALLISFGGVYATIAGEILRRSLVRDVKDYYKQLNIKSKHERFIVLLGIAIISFIFALLVIAGLSILIIFIVRGYVVF